MTTKQQKDFEIHYAKKTGELLGESWEVKSAPDEVNWPDLIVTTKSGKFGLEVREIYRDESSKGSIKKALEKKNLKKINKLASAYYNKTRPPIRVNFLGDIGHHDQLLNSITEEAGQLSEWEQKRIELYDGDGCVIYILKLPDPCGEYVRWNYVSDKVGKSSSINADIINKAISYKAENLQKYTREIPDVRLLLVSDRTFNSGKARLTDDINCDARGFKKLYYLSSPDEVRLLN